MGVWEFRETDRGPRLYRDEKALTAPDPAASAARRLAAVERRPQRLYLLLSPVFPDSIAPFLDTLPESSLVVLVEPESRAIQENRRAWELLRQRSGVELLFGLDLEETSRRVTELIEAYRVRSLRAVWMTGAARQAKGYHDAVIARAEESLALVWQNRATVISLGRLWIRNLFRNLLEFDQGIDQAASLADRPILVAGAGPSLEEHGELIRRIRTGVRLLAVDTALPYLLALDIVPDAVVSMDSQQLNVKDLIPTPPPGIRLLADATAAPSFVRAFPRHLRYAFVSHFAESSLWGLLEEANLRIPMLQAGGSVGTTSLLLADHLRHLAGRRELPILLAGLDFAFTPGLPHARMTYTHILTLTSRSRLAPEPFLPPHLARKRLPAPAKGGGTVRTDYVLAGYAARLRAAAGRFSGVLDLTSRGVDLGLPLIEPDDAEELVVSWASEGEGASTAAGGGAAEVGGTAGAPQPAGAWKRRAYAFLRREEWAIRKLAALIRQGEQGWDQARVLLEEHDYITFYFPDPAPRRDPSYLRRVIASASYFLRHCIWPDEEP